MKFSITLSDKEREDVFGKNTSQKFDLIINGTKFDCLPYAAYIDSRCETTIAGYGVDKKAQELAQAKAEVNRTKEAHKEAQRKLSALM